MSTAPPALLDGARVKLFAQLGAVRPTGAVRHSVANFNEVVVKLAIAQYDGSSDVYLFYCTEAWDVVADTCHATEQDAVSQAEFEFTNLTFDRLDSEGKY